MKTMKCMKSFVFVTPAGWDKDTDMDMENLTNLFNTYKQLTSDPDSPKPFVDVLEISEDLRESLVNQMLLEHGVIKTTKNIVSFPDQNSVVVILPLVDLDRYLASYEAFLKHTQEGLVKNINLLTQQLLVVSSFKKKYVKPVVKQ